jgi:hypothetical protein
VHIEAAGERLDLTGAVGKIDPDDARFWIDLDASSRQKLAPLLARARTSHDGPRQRTLSIDADRLLAWQLNWRGENFYSGGEIWQAKFPDAQTVFIKTDNVEFKKYITDPERVGKGRRFFVITEKGRLAGFPGTPGVNNPTVRKTFQVEDNSSNKFGLGSFQLDGAPRPAPPPVIEQVQ